MNIYIPTLIYSEENCVEKYGRIMAKTGRKALIVTGRKSSRVNGSLDDVIKALEANGGQYVIFDQVEENPSIETVMEARKLGIQEKVDYVIGVGGGSPIDAAKAIALMLGNPQCDESILFQSEMRRYLPVVAVPTTAGTGTEVTPYSILTIHEKRTKKSISHRIYPVLALVDYKYLKTQSQEVLVNTAVDALAHLVESYLNTKADDLNKMYSEKGLKLFGEIKDKFKSLENSVYITLSNMAMIAGMAIAHTGTSLPHGLSYMLTYELGIPHGKACGVYLGRYMEMYAAHDKAAVDKVLEALGMKTVEEFMGYLKALIGEVEVPEEVMKANAEGIMSNVDKLKNYPYEVKTEELIVS